MNNLFRIYAGLRFDRIPVDTDGVSPHSFKISVDGTCCAFDFHTCVINSVLGHPLLEIYLKNPTEETLAALNCLSRFHFNNIDKICDVNIEFDDGSDLGFMGLSYLSFVYGSFSNIIQVPEVLLEEYNSSLATVLIG